MNFKLLLFFAALPWLPGCGEPDIPSPLALQTPAQRGMAVVTANACTACHALDGKRGIGPGWGGIYGTTRALKGGGSVVVDDDYLRRAILQPAVEVVDGFDSVMVPAAVTEEQLADIIALIKELADTTIP